MLIRTTTHEYHECIPQEQHALISGCLASAWTSSQLSPILVHLVGLHDTAWRTTDQNPHLNPQRGIPHDFITYPTEHKIALYTRGLDLLETINPWVALLVSRHYTTFAGTKSLEEFQAAETRRRERLTSQIAPHQLTSQIAPHQLEISDQALAWLKYFDIFSLFICLSGPLADPEQIPRWLKNPDDWSQAPDGTDLKLRWLDDHTLQVTNWPFAVNSLPIDLYPRRLPTTYQSQQSLETAWHNAIRVRRQLTLVPA